MGQQVTIKQYETMKQQQTLEKNKKPIQVMNIRECLGKDDVKLLNKIYTDRGGFRISSKGWQRYLQGVAKKI